MNFLLRSISGQLPARTFARNLFKTVLKSVDINLKIFFLECEICEGHKSVTGHNAMPHNMPDLGANLRLPLKSTFGQEGNMNAYM